MGPLQQPGVVDVKRAPAFIPRSARRLPTGRRKRAFKYIAIIAATLVLAVGGYLGWKLIHNASKMAGGNLLGLLSDTKLKGEDQGRVNILLAGNSADDPGHGGSNLTDSIMIVSIDTKSNAAFMLSVPRDLWVNIPGNGEQKINAAYADGQAQHFSESGYPDGGMGLLEKVIEKNFGLDMNYYVLSNYSAFKQAVDAVGGIDVTIKSPDSRGIYDPNISAADHGPLRLKNGQQHLDGQTALNLARARNDPTADGRTGYGLPNGDFDRAADQRLMLTGLQAKITSTSVLSNPVKIGQLLDALGNNVKTNFQTNELRRLYDLGKSVNGSSVKSLSLTDKKLIKNYTSDDGQAALIPAAGADDYSQIQLYIKQLTSSDPAVKEGATVVVLNGSGTNGAAKKQATALQARGINVTSYDNAAGTYPHTIIVDNTHGAKPATLSMLLSNLPGSTASSAPQEDTTGADFYVILGGN